MGTTKKREKKCLWLIRCLCVVAKSNRKKLRSNFLKNKEKKGRNKNENLHKRLVVTWSRSKNTGRFAPHLGDQHSSFTFRLLMVNAQRLMLILAHAGLTGTKKIISNSECLLEHKPRASAAFLLLFCKNIAT